MLIQYLANICAFLQSVRSKPTAYKTPEWAAAAEAEAEGKGSADAGASSLHKSSIAGIVSMATAFALLGSPTGAEAQNTISAEVFEKCKAEYIDNYATKIAKAESEGKSHLVPKFILLRDRNIQELCTLRADTVAGEQRIAAGEQRIAALKADTAAGEQRIAANKELELLFDRAKQIADKITAGSTNSADFKELNFVYSELQKRQSDPGASRLLPLIANLLAKSGQLKEK